ncbi:MAG: hypothetical protein CPDRYMAC_1690 [uncultured Paraburkholderia sp.]|nr:MAG: hypothetical protein CPDRYDRY_1661 [uncultured Paraburkholderia sp.]CAH2919890.1 MAG: hypothetical protein CPDRYMAC_1690 [uncultured Paraburkholderia sp.]
MKVFVLGDRNDVGLFRNLLQLGGDSTGVLSNFAERATCPPRTVSFPRSCNRCNTARRLRRRCACSRAARLMAMEEKAAKLPPKITLPMMIFILLTVVMIAYGPAILTLGSVFEELLK